jgi:peptide/nickel transport system substrate-binding protein
MAENADMIQKGRTNMYGISRRGLMKSGVAAGVLGLSGMPLRAATMGGKLTAGLGGANTSDSWDSRTHSDIFMIASCHGAGCDSLTEIAADATLKGELAESWEASTDAKTWTFNLRSGVTFHNGKAFGADDVIESLQMHIGEE